MIEKRLVQWYASDSGVDLDIAEREIVLTYVLRILADREVLPRLAFKGGTSIRKIFLGNQGRFSLDLDFTTLEEVNPEDIILDVERIFHDQTVFGLRFSVPGEDYYTTRGSCGIKVSYQHEWSSNGTFDIEISLRDKPVLTVKKMALRNERYFEWLGVEPLPVPTLDLHEIIGEKIRAAVQRNQVRDLYDLCQLSSLHFDPGIVRRIAVIKCWETRFAFTPATLWDDIRLDQYHWSDLRRLVRRGWEISPETIIRGVSKGYAFLDELTEDEAILAGDAYRREQKIYRMMINSLRAPE